MGRPLNPALTVNKGAQKYTSPYNNTQILLLWTRLLSFSFTLTSPPLPLSSTQSISLPLFLHTLNSFGRRIHSPCCSHTVTNAWLHTLDFFLHSLFSFYIPVFVFYGSSFFLSLLLYCSISLLHKHHPHLCVCVSGGGYPHLFTALQANTHAQIHRNYPVWNGARHVYVQQKYLQPSPTTFHTHIQADLHGDLKTSGHMRTLTFKRPHTLAYSVVGAWKHSRIRGLNQTITYRL